MSKDEVEELAESLYATGDCIDGVSYDEIERWVKAMYYDQAQRLIKCGYRKPSVKALSEHDYESLLKENEVLREQNLKMNEQLLSNAKGVSVEECPCGTEFSGGSCPNGHDLKPIKKSHALIPSTAGEVTEALEIAKECIEHAIYHEDGLDGDVGQRAIKKILKALKSTKTRKV